MGMSYLRPHHNIKLPCGASLVVCVVCTTPLYDEPTLSCVVLKWVFIRSLCLFTVEIFVYVRIFNKPLPFHQFMPLHFTLLWENYPCVVDMDTHHTYKLIRIRDVMQYMLILLIPCARIYFFGKPKRLTLDSRLSGSKDVSQMYETHYMYLLKFRVTWSWC